MKAGMHVGAAVLAAAVGLGAGPAAAWELVGTKTVALVTREGLAVPIGTVDFRPEGGRVRFTVQLDESRFKDYFLSMWPFKCIDGGGETTCHVHYPYDMPATVTADDLAWLEHALLFFHNVPRDYAAKLDKGLYYKMKLTDDGIVGTPQAVLDQIQAYAAAGSQYITFFLPDAQDIAAIQLLGESVLPHLRDL